jgi:hypothetical protein
MPELPVVLSRKQVAELLGKSVRSVLRLDEIGALHPTRGDDGTVTYTRTEVAALLSARGLAAHALEPRAPAAPSPGALTAKIFRDLRAGKSLLDVTIELELTPEVAEQALAAYARISRALIITGPERERLRTMLPKASTPTGLLNALAVLVRDYNELHRFVFDCAVCGKPVQARSGVEWAHLIEHGVFASWTHDDCDDDSD